MDVVPIKRALISVSDKTGIVEFSKELVSRGVEILSTGGTSKTLNENGVPVKSVDSYTGHPEIMDGRVKTLHPKVHGGILAVRENPEHMKQMAENGIEPIDLVVVNLYPFQKTVFRKDVTIEDAIENIDIGGPTMVRSSAKNHAYVSIVVDPADYSLVLSEMSRHGGLTFESRKMLAVKAFRHTADYDANIDKYLSGVYLDEQILRMSYVKGKSLRYGENPHQKAVFFKGKSNEPSLANARQLHGKELSFNNIVDGDAALEVIKEFSDFASAAVIKHTNPCGLATGKSLDQALEAAWSGDPVSAFGSIIAVNRIMDRSAAQVLEGRFVEMIIAPDFTPEALQFLQEKSMAIRLLAVGDLPGSEKESFTMKHVTGGLLWQDRDTTVSEKWENVTGEHFPERKEMLGHFAWSVCKHVKSNAIVLAHEYAQGFYRVLGMGAGQPNRVDALRKLAVPKAIENLIREYQGAGREIPEEMEFPEFKEMVMASDAFFPFPDAIEEASEAGIRYIVQPGGSKRDSEVIETCNRYGIAMVFTGTRHFCH
ncbi:MAG: bifunctional phosphoribosylaminoimidazolecarboxamide formyltransferase/IMP cyclohydrolase [Fibrobacter sp.]|nr:bifunctional phosphoribosylaminoimidazolecarboxamide formyltransferase/IMP cyclohydrolase [Fibrobacter sp.]